MRVSATTTSLSWIPSESVWGPLKLGFDLGLSHWDEPMPDRISGVDEVQALHDTGRFRFANILQAWVDIEDGRIVGHGFGDRSGLLMGETTVPVAGRWWSGRPPAAGRRSLCPGRFRTHRSCGGRRRSCGRRWP